jgi:hypothetical protein
MRSLSLTTAILMGAMAPYRMAEDAPSSAPAAPEPAAVGTLVEVPVEHVTLVKRVLALLEKDATWLKDNIEAGVTHFEGMFKEDEPPTVA